MKVIFQWYINCNLFKSDHSISIKENNNPLPNSNLLFVNIIDNYAADWFLRSDRYFPTNRGFYLFVCFYLIVFAWYTNNFKGVVLYSWCWNIFITLLWNLEMIFRTTIRILNQVMSLYLSGYGSISTDLTQEWITHTLSWILHIVSHFISFLYLVPPHTPSPLYLYRCSASTSLVRSLS